MQLSIFVRLYGTYVQRRENGPFFARPFFFREMTTKLGLIYFEIALQFGRRGPLYSVRTA
jgi:hypothetical protein